jgi:hypothetical protein
MVTFRIHYLPAISLAKIRTCNQKHKKPFHLTRIFMSKELFNKIGNLWSKIEYPALLQTAASKNCPWATILWELQEERKLEISGLQIRSAINFTWQVKKGVWIRALVQEIISTCAVSTCVIKQFILSFVANTWVCIMWEENHTAKPFGSCPFTNPLFWLQDHVFKGRIWFYLSHVNVLQSLSPVFH